MFGLIGEISRVLQNAVRRLRLSMSDVGVTAATNVIQFQGECNDDRYAQQMPTEQ